MANVTVFLDDSTRKALDHYCIDGDTTKTEIFRKHIIEILDGSHERMVADQALLISMCQEADVDEVLAALKARRVAMGEKGGER